MLTLNALKSKCKHCTDGCKWIFHIYNRPYYVLGWLWSPRVRAVCKECNCLTEARND